MRRDGTKKRKESLLRDLNNRENGVGVDLCHESSLVRRFELNMSGVREIVKRPLSLTIHGFIHSSYEPGV